MITYTYDAVKFILENYKTFQSGIWGNPGAAADAGIPIKNQGHRAPFEAPVIYAAEIARRVKLCGTDGMIVEERYGLKGEPKEPKDIYNERKITVAHILYTSDKVTLYCCDFEFYLGISYQTWKSNATNRKKITRLSQSVAENLTNAT